VREVRPGNGPAGGASLAGAGEGDSIAASGQRSSAEQDSAGACSACPPTKTVSTPAVPASGRRHPRGHRAFPHEILPNRPGFTDVSIWRRRRAVAAARPRA
jgi:hypothetical protein